MQIRSRRSSATFRKRSSVAGSPKPGWASTRYQPVSGSDPAPLALPGRKLENGAGSAATGGAPGLQVSYDPNDAVVCVKEERVDREAHERCVNGRSRAEQEPLSGVEPRAPEQPLHPPHGIRGDRAAFAERAPVFESKLHVLNV